MGITLSDAEIREAAYGIEKEKVTIIDVGNHAFKRVEGMPTQEEAVK